MTTARLIKKIEKLKELEATIKETEREVDKLKAELKAEMHKQNKDEMNCGRYVMRWKEVSSSRLDSTALKKNCPDIYKMYAKQTVSMRFTING
jgi:predicted phage-related endonuclease